MNRQAEMDLMKVSQGFERFGPWVEKAMASRLGWIEVKTIVQKPVVDPLGAEILLRQPDGRSVDALVPMYSWVEYIQA